MYASHCVVSTLIPGSILLQLTCALGQISIISQPSLHITPIPLKPASFRPNPIKALLQRSVEILPIKSVIVIPATANHTSRIENNAYLRISPLKPLLHLRQLLLIHKPTCADLDNRT